MSARTRGIACLFALVLAASFAAVPAAASAAVGSVRGFDGSTVTVAGFGNPQNFANAGLGAEARIQRFNDSNEIKGVKLSWAGFADDKQDPATALSEERRLVTQEQVFALVGVVSNFTGSYLRQQKVPYFGWGYDTSYCSTQTDTGIYGFSWDGCVTPPSPDVFPDSARSVFTYVSKKTGKQHPTITLFSDSSEAGKLGVQNSTLPVKKAGFDVVATNNEMAPPPINDYTPIVQSLLSSDNGKAPDVLFCLTGTQCLNVYNLLRPSGFQGIFISSLYSNILVKALAGSIVNIQTANLDDDVPALTTLKHDVDAFQSGASAKLDTGMFVGYASTDMFIQALKTVAKKGKSNITPENVQKAAMNQTWKMEGVAGPTVYPKSTQTTYQYCGSVLESDGTTWTTVEPFSCTTKQYAAK